MSPGGGTGETSVGPGRVTEGEHDERGTTATRRRPLRAPPRVPFRRPLGASFRRADTGGASRSGRIRDSSRKLGSLIKVPDGAPWSRRGEPFGKAGASRAFRPPDGG